MTPESSCAITGATGYLGGRIRARLEAAGIRTVSLSRRRGAADEAHVAFELGRDVDPGALRAHRVGALVHCAYDFRQRSAAAIERVNVGGSRKLFAAARAAGVAPVVYLSSMSAFPGCRSKYGRAKLMLEEEVLEAGGAVLRPGLAFGTRPGGMFALLQSAVDASPVLPAIGGGRARLRLVLDDDLARLVAAIVAGEMPPPAEPLVVAHPAPLSLADILRRVAALRGRRVTLVPVPWRAAWLGLGVVERLAPGLGLRSDSVISLVSQDERPVFRADLLDRIGMTSLDAFVAAHRPGAAAGRRRP